MASWPKKDPDETLDYVVDWTAFLTDANAEVDAIESVTWNVPAGLTTVATSSTSTKATIWLSGGTAGESYEVRCKVTTESGRVAERTVRLKVAQR